MGTFSQSGVVWDSITKNGKHEPFELQVGRGYITNHQIVEIFGYSTSVGSTALGPLWEGLTSSGGNYVYPGSAVQMTIVSTSASDTSALSIVINGLDINFNPLQETIALNGTTNVTSVNSYYRINSVVCTNGLNVGAISLKNSSTLYAQINAGIGQTQMSIYTVPAGYTYYLGSVQANANIGFTSSAYMTYAEYNKFNLSNIVQSGGYSFTTQANTSVLSQSPFVQIFNSNYSIPVAHPAGTDIQYQLKASTGTNSVGSIFANGILIADPTTTNF